MVHKLILSLSLCNVFCTYLEESPFAHIVKKQISHLVVTVIDDTDTISLDDLATDVYARIFTLFTNLTHLEFDAYNTYRLMPLTFYSFPSNICFSSSIVYLCIKVLFLEDCLCLLDGRLY